MGRARVGAARPCFGWSGMVSSERYCPRRRTLRLSPGLALRCASARSRVNTRDGLQGRPFVVSTWRLRLRYPEGLRKPCAMAERISGERMHPRHQHTQSSRSRP